MPPMGRNVAVRPPKPKRQPPPPGSRREQLAVQLALISIVCLGLVFVFSKGTQFLMPGPLASAHGSIESCGACHTKSGTGKLSWFHGLVAGDPLADSKACLTCHKMPETAFNAHSTFPEVLKRSTDRLTKVAALTPAPQSARAQNIAFPAQPVVDGGLFCATCHQEHQGVNFNLNKISNEQCRSCHVVKFDSFDGHHPQFDNYPFKRRTRIIYDHASHFGKHFPEIEKKDATRRIPSTCSSCHSSRADKRVMAVTSFDQTCSTCHLDQIIGKERASGPKGVAFLTLPGLDVQTLKEKNAAIGEWPEGSEAPLTPFMKAMIGRNERGLALIKTVAGVNLLDLADANDDQIQAVTDLVWEVKRLYYALVSGKASDVLGDLNVGGGAKLSAGLVADLTASLPRDVIIGAYQQWLPNLGTEMANRPETTALEQSGWAAVITESKLAATVSPEELAGLDARRPAPRRSPQAPAREAVSTAKPVQLAQAASPPARAADQTDDLLFPDGGAPAAPATASKPAEPPVSKAPAKDAEKAVQPEVAAEKPAAAAPAKPAGAKETPAADARPRAQATGQEDDLLYPDGGAPAAPAAPATPPAAATADPGEWTAEEVSTTNALPDNAAASAAPDAEAPAASDPAAAAAEEPQAKAVPVISIASDVDPESWAEYGGWYRQDYAIYYRPTGHKDKFIYSWLFLTGLKAPKGDASPAAAVFDYLIGKDAQGSCAKCHSVDDVLGKGRLVNFSPPKPEMKQGRFTTFIHEPHFGIMKDRGCLTCHNLEKGRPYLKSFEQDNPRNFVSSFGAVKKDLCQTCHTASMARQDCLLCHKYHVDGVITPTMNTTIPAQ
jgi:hypothetical protein